MSKPAQLELFPITPIMECMEDLVLVAQCMRGNYVNTDWKDVAFSDVLNKLYNALDVPAGEPNDRRALAALRNRLALL